MSQTWKMILGGVAVVAVAGLAYTYAKHSGAAGPRNVAPSQAAPGAGNVGGRPGINSPGPFNATAATPGPQVPQGASWGTQLGDASRAAQGIFSLGSEIFGALSSDDDEG